MLKAVPHMIQRISSDSDGINQWFSNCRSSTTVVLEILMSLTILHLLSCRWFILYFLQIGSIFNKSDMIRSRFKSGGTWKATHFIYEVVLWGVWEPLRSMTQGTDTGIIHRQQQLKLSREEKSRGRHLSVCFTQRAAAGSRGRRFDAGVVDWEGESQREEGFQQTSTWLKSH